MIMALFNKKDTRLPDLPNPPSKFSDISKKDFEEEDFPSYTPTVNFDEEVDEKPKISSMPMSSFMKDDSMMGEPEHEHYGGKKPLFIKIDKYEDAIGILDSIKESLNEADKLINELRQIRRDEDAQLDEWNEHLKSIKDKLMSVDSTLFE